MAEDPLYALGSRPLMFPTGEAPVWNSPVFVPTVGRGIRRKDRTLLMEGQTVRQAISDRWGPGSVFDWNPDGAVWDLVPDARGRYARHFPPTPVLPYGPGWPESLDPGSRNRGSRNFTTVPFGAATARSGRFGLSAPTTRDMFRTPPPPVSGPASAPASASVPREFLPRTPLLPAKVADTARSMVRRPAEVSAPTSSRFDGLALAGAAVVAFGAGVLLGSWLKGI